jgi:hypothetical protein
LHDCHHGGATMVVVGTLTYYVLLVISFWRILARLLKSHSRVLILSWFSPYLMTNLSF